MLGVVKFCAGLIDVRVYFMPILIAEKGDWSIAYDSALSRDICPGLPTDGLHWVIMVNADRIWLDGKVAPGPDYRLYLTLKYVEPTQVSDD